MTTSHGIRSQKPPEVSQTGLGYRYVRCQQGDSDETVYIHQLCAILGGADPHDVFSDLYDVHHKPLDTWLDLDEPTPPLKGLNCPRGVELVPRWEHRTSHVQEASDA